MKPIRMNLGLKFSLAVTLLILFTMLGVATLIVNYQKESLRQNTFASNRTMTSNLASEAVEPLIVFDPLQLEELVKTALSVPSCAYAMIVDRDGVIVAHTRRVLLGTHLTLQNRPERSPMLTEAKDMVREYQYEGKVVKEFSVPVRIGKEVLGFAVIGYSTRDIDAGIEARLKNLKRYITMITGIMLFAGIAGAFGVSTVLTRPLKRLKSKMLDVQAGNLDVEVENPKIVACWERLECKQSDCPAYGKLRCWSIAGTFCRDAVQVDVAQKLGDCRQCVVYRESCGDEIHELVEVFSQMVKDLKHNLNALEKADSEKARLERLSALGEMAAIVAHETKNPLNSIRLAASYLKKNFHGEILSEFLSIIEQEVMRLNDITSNFLFFSKPAPLSLKRCDINAVVRSTAALIRQEATDRNIEVVILIDEHIPPVPCDFSQLKQALLNLLINAMDASQEGDTIMITTEAEGDSIRISVQDTGKGIDQRVVENIFKPFYTTKTRGSGLGLAIVDRIVKEHKGKIEVDSALGKGTKFTIELPVQSYAKA